LCCVWHPLVHPKKKRVGDLTQNTSTAVMARRKEPHGSLDYFPTPPWATRALAKHCVDLSNKRVWEPACGDGHMSRVLAESAWVYASDVHDYGWGHEVHDFLMPFLPHDMGAVDWVITNPPFRLAEQFIQRGLEVARCGVAVLVRLAFVESIQRYESLFRDREPAIIAQFVERVPMVKGKVDEDASSATAYCWMIWNRLPSPTRMQWIPPCRSKLEKPGDYAAFLHEEQQP
jgi:hypothetical protein